MMELMSEGLQPVFLPLDVDSEESIQAAKEAVHMQFGRLDVLVNNAGVLFRVRLTQFSVPMSEETSWGQYIWSCVCIIGDVEHKQTLCAPC